MYNFSFKEWLNEAVISRKPLYIDEDDIRYLKQFEANRWVQALKYRYNEAIMGAISHGELKPEYKDLQEIDVPIQSHGKTTHKRVWFGFPQLFSKLKNAGYDFSGTNDINKESLFYKPMASETANSIVQQIKRTDPNYGKFSSEINPQPNIIKFSPNHNLTARNDPEMSVPGGTSLNDKFKEERGEISQEVHKTLQSLMSGNHINSLYWRDPMNYNMLFKKVLDRIWLGWADMKMHDPKFRKRIITLEFSKAIQGGVITRRKLEKLRTSFGIDIHQIPNQINQSTGLHWTLPEIDRVVKNSKTYEEMAYKFKHGDRAAAVA